MSEVGAGRSAPRVGVASITAHERERPSHPPYVGEVSLNQLAKV